jgi:hypothetical protein
VPVYDRSYDIIELMKILNFLNKTYAVYNVKGIEIEARYWMALAIGIMCFLLVFTLARLRYLYVHWNLGKSSLSFLFYGFLLALILEGFLIISGKTFIIEALGWKNPPKPISTVLDISRQKLVDVLGVKDEIPMSQAAEKATSQSVVGDYVNLSIEDQQVVKSYICQP